MPFAFDAVSVNITAAYGFRKLLTAYTDNLFDANAGSNLAIPALADGSPDRETLRAHAGAVDTYCSKLYDQSGVATPHPSQRASGILSAWLHLKRAPVAMGDRIAMSTASDGSTHEVPLTPQTMTSIFAANAGTVFTVSMIQRNQGASPDGYPNPGSWDTNGQNLGTHWRVVAGVWRIQAYMWDGVAAAAKVSEVIIDKDVEIYRPLPVCWRVGSGVIRCKVYGYDWGPAVACGDLERGDNAIMLGYGQADGMYGEAVFCNAAISDAQVDAIQLEQATYWRRFVESGGGGGSGGMLVGPTNLVNRGAA